MSQLIDTLLTDLRSLIADLGKDGGLISPSVYDTAQVLRFCPPKEGVVPALEWILGQQQPDGGWGNPAVPLSRHMPTLASVLALRTYSKINPQKIESRIEAGIEFLRQHADQWLDAHIDDYPIAVEVVLPKLLEDAQALGITLPRGPYVELMKLGNKKRQRIAQMKPRAGTAPTYSWEAWGTNPTTDVVDAIGSVGTSPAATAAWVDMAHRNPDLADTRQVARSYLEQASAATCIQIPGVVPTAHPITHFDQHYSLYALLISGLLDHPAFKKEIKFQSLNIWSDLRPTGMGYCTYFTTDADDTSVALIVLQAVGYNADTLNILNHFKHNDHFITFSNEFNPSILTNAHVFHALARANKEASQSRRFLLKHQRSDGRWRPDKWHSSWLYTTLEVILALSYSEDMQALELACHTVLSHQHEDGGWGMNGKSISLETAYAVLILYILKSHTFFNEYGQNALYRGYEWLLNRYHTFSLNEVPLWIGKDLYSVYRVDRIFKLSAILSITLEEV